MIPLPLGALTLHFDTATYTTIVLSLLLSGFGFFASGYYAGHSTLSSETAAGLRRIWIAVFLLIGSGGILFAIRETPVNIARPASQTPISALKLGEIILQSGWPEGAFSVVPSTTQAAAPLIEDDRIRLLTFTGSPSVGWGLKTRAGRKRVTLELGGNAGVIVHNDADLKYAAERIAWGGFSYAGQSCISVQRVYVHDDVYQTFVDQFVTRVKALVVDNPLNDTTDVGPVINRGEAERVELWVAEARQNGAEVLAGGTRTGNLWYPTVLGSVQPTMRVSCQEVFAPLVGVYRYTDVRQAIAAVDDSDFGLQAGLFTNDLNIVQAAFEDIEVGGLMVNDVSTFRIDHMPYGGVKQSGAGREGLRYAIEEMSELKLLTFNHRG